jgi:hypothetical protein
MLNTTQGKHWVVNSGQYKVVSNNVPIHLHETILMSSESMIKYTFCDPCQEKCKVAIKHALTYQILQYYLI